LKNYRQIVTLLQKELLLEIRQQYSFYGVVLYVASTIFVVYLSMGQPEYTVWNGLFWIVQLFVCVNAVAKSFLAETKGRLLYYYSIVNAQQFIIAKLLFNVVLMATMTLISWLLFTVWLGNPVEENLSFLALSMLGSISVSLVFTFLSAIAASAQQNAALMAIMGFPLIIPQLLLLMRISSIAFSAVVQAGLTNAILLLIAFDVLVITLSIILFPFLWADGKDAR
jgi:heme exporter protein B